SLYPLSLHDALPILFVHTRSDPYGLVQPITRIIRGLSPDQPVERAATLEDVRAEVLTPDRLNAMVFGGFAAVALAIAVVGVAGRSEEHTSELQSRSE